ncbi:MAG: histidinol-phosphate transaminase [Thermodesulfovibrionales bacterium]|nr:histidinol-phosphate transaminase [Thermodesulfovibrionales bacterium]
MSNYWSPIVRTIHPYVPGEQPKGLDFIKLNTNENPYPPSPTVLQAIKEALNDIRKYPDPEGYALRKAIGEYYGVSHNNVFVGNGSDEILALSFMAFFMGGRKVLFPDITYTFYEVYSHLFGVDAIVIPLMEDFCIDVQSYCKNIGGVIIANPNAPTGILLTHEEIERIVSTNQDNVVIIDEAYIDFGGESAVGLIDKYDNLLVIQTFSKSRSLAGLRVGFAIGDVALIEGLMRVKDSFNSYPLDRLALAGAEASIKDREYFETTRQKIISTRQWAYEKLLRLGFSVTKSMSNFLFVSHDALNAQTICDALRQRKILVRYFKRPRIDNHIRITVGKMDEMEILIDALKDILNR